MSPQARRKLKDKLAARYGKKCMLCDLRYKDARELELHHVIPVRENGANTIDNCALLCPSCHDELHKSCENEKYYNDSIIFYKKRV